MLEANKCFSCRKLLANYVVSCLRGGDRYQPDAARTDELDEGPQRAEKLFASWVATNLLLEKGFVAHLSLSVSFRGSYCPTTYGLGAAAVDSFSDCPSDWKSVQEGWWTNPETGDSENFWETFLPTEDCILNSYGMSISECDDLGCTDCDTC